MHIWKKLGLVVAGGLLPVLLMVWGVLFSLYNVVGTPVHIKSALRESGVYNRLVHDILDQQKQKNEEQGQQGNKQDIPLDNPDIQKVIENAASPSFLQTQVESVLDSLYAWLHGKTPNLAISVDLTEIKNNIRTGFGDYASNRLKGLPACGKGASAANFDVFTATCIPKGVDTNAAINEVRSEIDNAFSQNDSTQPEDDLTKNVGSSLQDKLSVVPKVFSQVTLALWIMVAVILLCTAGIVWLSEPWRAGLKRAAIVFLGVGVMSAGLALLGTFALGEAVKKLGTDNLQVSAVSVLHSLSSDLRSWWLGYSIVLVVIGAGLFGWYFLTKPKDGATKTDKDGKPSDEEHKKETPTTEKSSPAN